MVAGRYVCRGPTSVGAQESPGSEAWIVIRRIRCLTALVDWIFDILWFDVDWYVAHLLTIDYRKHYESRFTRRQLYFASSCGNDILEVPSSGRPNGARRGIHLL